MYLLNLLALGLGWTVMVAGGIALTAAIVHLAWDRVVTYYGSGHDILEIARRLSVEKRLAQAEKARQAAGTSKSL